MTCSPDSLLRDHIECLLNGQLAFPGKKAKCYMCCLLSELPLLFHVLCRTAAFSFITFTRATSVFAFSKTGFKVNLGTRCLRCVKPESFGCDQFCPRRRQPRGAQELTPKQGSLSSHWGSCGLLRAGVGAGFPWGGDLKNLMGRNAALFKGMGAEKGCISVLQELVL